MARFVVGIGQTVLAENPGDTIEMIGLGSCAGIFIALPGKIAVAAHSLLAVSMENDSGSPPGKYVETAIPHLIETLAGIAVAKRRYQAWVVGGAQIFTFGGQSESASIGTRNTDLAVELLRKAGFQPDSSFIGGTHARRASLDLSTGAFDSSTVQKG